MAENHVYGELATTQCYNACRQLLKDRNGYECGAEEGTFLAAFSSGTDALQFCVLVRLPFPRPKWHTLGAPDNKPCQVQQLCV